MKRTAAIFLILFLDLIFTCILYAQTRRAIQYREHPSEYRKKLHYYTVGGFVAALNYFGDLAPTNQFGSTNLPLTRPGLGISGRYRWKHFISLRGNLMWGRLRGDDFSADKMDEDGKYRYTRNLHFRNDIKELSLQMVFDLAGPYRTYATRPAFTPFVFIGISLFHHNPKAMVPAMDAVHFDLFEAQPIRQKDPRYGGVSPGEWIPLKPLGTEGQRFSDIGEDSYHNWQFAVPVGVGFRFRLSRHYDFAFEIGFRQTFTDYLDDVSGSYVDPEVFGESPQANLSRLMADRSKEPIAAVSGQARDLTYILQNVHPTRLYGEVPEEFGDRPYELIEGFGRSEVGIFRGKGASDIFMITKLSFTYIIGSGFGFNRNTGN